MLSATTYATEADVLSVPEVPETDTWKPIHHRRVIESLSRAIHEAGLEVRSKSYALNWSGRRMFATWELDRVDAGMAYAVGIRNSMDKSMALGIVAGTRIFVCENLAFSGEYIRFRKHTKGIIAELDELCQEAVAELIAKLQAFAAWHKRLITYVLRRRQAEVLTFRAMELGVINPTHFGLFYALYFDKEGPYHRPDLYHWHEAVTHVNTRATSPFQAIDRNRKLNEICNEFIARYGQRL